MAKGFTIRLEGLDEVERALAELGARTGKAALERAIRKAAKPMLDAAKAGAPKDDGDLEKSLIIGKKLKNEAGQAAYNAVKAAGGNKAVAVSAMRDARRNAGTSFAQLYLGPTLGKGKGSHGHLVEFGTGPRYHEDGKYVGEMPPRPFLRPAFDAQAEPTIKRLKPILAAEIDKAAKRAARRKAKRG